LRLVFQYELEKNKRASPLWGRFDSNVALYRYILNHNTTFKPLSSSTTARFFIAYGIDFTVGFSFNRGGRKVHCELIVKANAITDIKSKNT